LPKGAAADAIVLRRRVLNFYRAIGLLDMKKLAPFCSKKPKLLVFNDVEPMKLEGWEAFREAEGNVMARMSRWKLRPDGLRASVWENVGLSTATPLPTGESKAGKRCSLVLGHTAVWEKRGGQWLMVHHHWSIPWL
jgi:ketosteroid isomerase-like protein